MKKCFSCSQNVEEKFQWQYLLTGWLRSDAPSIASFLCKPCLAQLSVLQDQLCPCCSRPLELLDPQYIVEWKRGKICYDCLRWKEWQGQQGLGDILEQNRSLVIYDELLEKWIHQYKFLGDIRYEYVFAALMKTYWIQTEYASQHFDLVIPIPLAPQRLAERGFNQSEKISSHLAKFIHIQYNPHVLQREQDDHNRQSQRNRSERLKDLLHKFIKNPHTSVDIDNKTILLIDDIYTTGATMYAAAYCLKQLGVESVYGFSLARAL